METTAVEYVVFALCAVIVLAGAFGVIWLLLTQGDR